MEKQLKYQIEIEGSATVLEIISSLEQIIEDLKMGHLPEEDAEWNNGGHLSIEMCEMA